MNERLPNTNAMAGSGAGTKHSWGQIGGEATDVGRMSLTGVWMHIGCTDFIIDDLDNQYFYIFWIQGNLNYAYYWIGLSVKFSRF